jgi:hypothetical protein
MAITTDPATLMPHIIMMVGKTLSEGNQRVLNSILVDLKNTTAAQGDTIDSIFDYGMKVGDVVPSETIPTFDAPEHSNVSISLDYWKNVKFKYDAKFLSGQGVNRFATDSIFTAAVSLMDFITNTVAQALRVTPNIVAQTTTPLGAYSEIVGLNRLITSNAPSALRFAFFGRDTEAALFNETTIVGSINNSDGKTAKETGILPSLLRYGLIAYQPNEEDGLLADTNEVSGDITFTLPADMRAHEVYEVVTTTTGQDTKTFHPGNLLIDQSTGNLNNTTSLVIHEKAVITGTTATIKVSVGRKFHSFAGGSVTAKMINVIDDAFAYQKYGIGLITRPSSNVGMTRTSMHFDDRLNNLTYGITYMDAYYLKLLSLDTLYGVKILQRDYVARSVQMSTTNSGYVA